MSSRQVPQLSLLNYVNGTQSDKVQFIDQLFRGLKDYGFIVLEEHTVDQKKVDLAYNYIREFFALPVETKLKYCDEISKKQRGYIPFGMEHAKDNPNPDLKEFWHVGRDVAEDHIFKGYYPKNLWPSEVPEFQKVSQELYQSMDTTAAILLEALGEALDLPPNYFRDMIHDGNSVLRYIHYPPVEGEDTDNSIRAAAHGDINLITMLVGATDGGLQLLDHDGSWLDVQSSAGQIVVDTGDMMSRITNEVLPSTIHRVINPNDDKSERFSMPFFVHPHPEAMLSCLPSCLGNGAKYKDTISHDFLKQRLREIGLLSDSDMSSPY